MIASSHMNLMMTKCSKVVADCTELRSCATLSKAEFLSSKLNFEAALRKLRMTRPSLLKFSTLLLD